MNKNIAKCFRQAKKHLWNGNPRSYNSGDNNHYIWFAIDSTNVPRSVKKEAKAVIRSRLEGYGTLSCWLVSKGLDVSDIVPALLQKHRHDWLDLLIKEFES
jgi:hypothetical protein